MMADTSAQYGKTNKNGHDQDSKSIVRGLRACLEGKSGESGEVSEVFL